MRKETALAEQVECWARRHYRLLGTRVKQGRRIQVLVLGELHHVYRMGYWGCSASIAAALSPRQLNSLLQDPGLRVV